MQENGELALNSQTKVYSVSLLLYSDRSVCIHCTRALIGQMHDWSDDPKPGFMRLLADGLKSYGDGKIFEASLPDSAHNKPGLRSNCVVVTDRIYHKYDGDPQAHDVQHHKDATVVHTGVIDIKLFAKRPTFVEIIGYDAAEQKDGGREPAPASAFMSGSKIFSLASKAEQKQLGQTQVITPAIEKQRGDLDAALVPTLKPVPAKDINVMNKQITLASASIVKIIEAKESILYVLTEMLPVFSRPDYKVGRNHTQDYLTKEGGWIVAHFISGASFSYFFPGADNIALVEKVFLPIFSTGNYAVRHGYYHWKQEYIADSCVANVMADTVFGGVGNFPIYLMTGNFYAILYGAVQGGVIGVFSCIPTKPSESWSNNIANVISLGGLFYFSKSLSFNEFGEKLTSIMKISAALPVVTMVHKFINYVLSYINEMAWSSEIQLEEKPDLLGDINNDKFPQDL